MYIDQEQSSKIFNSNVIKRNPDIKFAFELTYDKISLIEQEHSFMEWIDFLLKKKKKS